MITANSLNGRASDCKKTLNRFERFPRFLNTLNHGNTYVYILIAFCYVYFTCSVAGACNCSMTSPVTSRGNSLCCDARTRCRQCWGACTCHSCLGSSHTSSTTHTLKTHQHVVTLCTELRYTQETV